VVSVTAGSSDRQIASFAVRGRTQHEIAAERKAGEHDRQVWKSLRQSAQCADDFRQPAGME
jgi:hypothetical protein